MSKLESVFSLNQKIQFTIQNTLFIGKVIGIIFVEHGVFYDIDVDGDIYKSVSEKDIQNV